MNERVNSSPTFCVPFPRCRWLCVAFAAGLQTPLDMRLEMEALAMEGRMAM